jgi:hypothetical protein
MAQAKYAKSQPTNLSVPIVTQRGIGSIVKRKSTLKTAKGEKTYMRYWIYVPADVAEDKSFPFKAGDKLLISITEGKKVFLEKA